MRRCYLPAVLLPALLATLLLTGCPKPPADGNGAAATRPQGTAGVDWNDTAAVYRRGKELSLLTGTPLANAIPDAVSFDRSGRYLWLHALQPDGAFYLGRFEVDGRLIPTPELQFDAPQLIRSYVQSAPSGEECFALSQQPLEGGRIQDVVFRHGLTIPAELEHRSGVPYRGVPGLPEGNHETYSTLKPFYSWDGSEMVLPFNNEGLALVKLQTGSGAYVPYPETEAAISSAAFGALPDEDGARRIWASFWRLGIDQDHCEVHLLDLDEREWTHMFTLPWVVYNIGVDRVVDAPWLVAGSYGQFEQITGDPLGAGRGEAARIPRVARVDPIDGTQELLALGGEPVWDIAVEQRGSHICYMDKARKGIVRLNMATGELDVDTRWFSPDDELRLFIVEDGQRCFAWRRELLIEADWQAHEVVDGYAGD